jgi:hypothetical protein
MKFTEQTRRAFLGTAAGAVTAGSFAKFAMAQKLTLPTQAVTLSVIDVAGNLALTQPTGRRSPISSPKSPSPRRRRQNCPGS